MGIKKQVKKVAKQFDDRPGSMHLKCVNKFFAFTRPHIIEVSNNDKFRKKFDGDVHSLGYEGGLEATIRLFKQGKLLLCAESENNFTVTLLNGNKITLLYDSKRGQ